MTPETYIERLLQASQKKVGLLTDLLNLTRAQGRAITEDGIEDLQKNIEEKQIRINEIDKIDEEFNVYFRRLKQQLNVKSLDELQSPGIKGVKELQSSVGLIIRLISEIDQLEKENNRRAKSLLDSLGSEVRKLNQAKKVSQAYSPSPAFKPPSYFIDKKK